MYRGMMMKDSDNKKKIRQFWCRLHIEAGVRAGMVGLTGGLAALAVVLLYGRLQYRKLLYTEDMVVAIAFFLFLSLIAYVVCYRPRKKQVLERIDGLGLEERMITMEELKQETSVVAEKQRQDTSEHLAALTLNAMKPRLDIKPLLWCIGFGVLTAVLVLLPFPKPEVDAQAEQNAVEMQLVDEMIVALREIVSKSELGEEYKAELTEIVDALAFSFTPEDSTLTRTAKIATASKRLDMMASSKKTELTLMKQRAEENGTDGQEVQQKEKDQKLLEAAIREMKDVLGTSIDVLNKVEGTFWTPGGPSSGTSYEVEELPTEETAGEEEPPEGEEGEPGEGEEPPEGMESGEGGEPQDGEWSGTGGQTIFDPEQGEISYGSVYEEYYQEILKALTEREFSGDIREMIEDYANSLE
jgi:hypothetical protein